MLDIDPVAPFFDKLTIIAQQLLRRVKYFVFFFANYLFLVKIEIVLEQNREVVGKRFKDAIDKLLLTNLLQEMLFEKGNFEIYLFLETFDF